jgi:hypothetical protein
MAFSRKLKVASVAGSLSLAMLTGCPAATPGGTLTPSNAPGSSTTPASTLPASTTPASTTPGTPGSTTPASTTPASTTPGSTAGPSTAVSAPVASGATVVVGGKVYDEAGATVDGAVITVNSLLASAPYTATVTASQGSYVLNAIPAGVNLEIVATKDNWTSRRRVASFQADNKNNNTVDFGGTQDAPGTAYFISKYPEIASTNPIYDATNVDNSTVSYQITLSEPLDSTNQSRFANSLRLIPADSYAAPDNDKSTFNADATVASGSTGTYNNFNDMKDAGLNAASLPDSSKDRSIDVDNTSLAAGPVVANGDARVGYADTAATGPGNVNAPGSVNSGGKNFTADATTNAGTRPNHPVKAANPNATVVVPYDYSIKNGTLFLNDANTAATVTWDATGSVATFTFNAPLTADRTNVAHYQLALVTQSATDRIVDKNNNQLGVDLNGSFQTAGTLGALIHATVKKPDLALINPTTGGPTAASRWVSTHQDSSRFGVKVDNVDPKLVSVSYRKNLNKSSRFELTFSKPMASYNGRPGGHVGSTIIDGTVLKSLSFAVSDRSGGTANVNLKGGTPSYWLAAQNKGGLFGIQGNARDIENEFFLSGATGTPTNTMGIASTGGAAGGTDPSAATSLIAYGTDITTAENTPATAGSYLLSVSTSNPRILFIYVVNRTSVFDSRIVELKVRAEGVPDPAGNTVKSSDADRQQITTTQVQ